MLRGTRLALLIVISMIFTGVAFADTIVKGTVILISHDMYTVKTDGGQGFRGSRETFYVDPKTTKKTGEIKLGSKVEAEVNINGTAYWIKAVGGAKNVMKSEPKKPTGKK